MAERALITKPKLEMQSAQAPEQELRSISAQKKYFYRVGGEEGKEKKAPSAAMVFALSDEHGNLFYEIVSAGKDAEKAWAHVQAWEGPRENPTRCLERYVCLRYIDDLTDATYRLLARGGISLFQGETWANRQPKKSWYRLQPDDWKIGEDGWPVILNPYVKLEIMQEHQRFRRFAERTAQTQAIRAALLQLLDSTWDEESEIQREEQVDSGQEHMEAPGDTRVTKTSEDVMTMDTRSSAQSLGQMKSDIWKIILNVCDNQLPHAYSWLKEYGQMEGKPVLKTISDIADLEMAQEILARAEAALQAKIGSTIPS